ncbi:hypothetical protein DFS33DRAFT_1290892 [Desarmillaria ectypa]|nr:hypothetical protein DFS33DRAFT_1290892 [Desarmillaria ectypa]
MIGASLLVVFILFRPDVQSGTLRQAPRCRTLRTSVFSRVQLLLDASILLQFADARRPSLYEMVWVSLLSVTRSVYCQPPALPYALIAYSAEKEAGKRGNRYVMQDTEVHIASYRM